MFFKYLKLLYVCLVIVRKVGINEIQTFGIGVKLEYLENDKFVLKTKEEKEEHASWTKATPLWGSKTILPTKAKTLSFYYDKDITCRLHYSNDENAPIPLPSNTDPILVVYNITGIAAFADEVAAKGLSAPKVHLSFSIDASGIVSLNKAEATVELPVTETEEETNDAKDATATSNSTDSETASASDNSTETATSTSTNTNSTTSTKETKKDKKKEKKDNTLRRTLIFKENLDVLNPKGWSAATIAMSKAKLRTLDDIDEKRKKREAALNDLETSLYSIRNQLQDDGDVKFGKVSTSEQREEIVSFCNEIEEWLYDAGATEDVNGFIKKKAELLSKFNPILERYEESKHRPEAIKKLRAQLHEIEVRISNWDTTMPHITTEEKNKLTDEIKAVEEWINTKVAAQEALALTEKPAFTSSEVPLQITSVNAILDKLLKKPRPTPPKVC